MSMFRVLTITSVYRNPTATTMITILRKSSQQRHRQCLVGMERSAVSSDGLTTLRENIDIDFSRKAELIRFDHIIWKDI